MSDHPEQVVAQLGSLLNQLAHFLNENEKYLSPDIYKFCYHSLPALEKLTLSKIVAILHTGDQNRSTDDRQDVCGWHNHGDTSSDSSNDAGGSLGNLTYSSGDKELSSDAEDSFGNLTYSSGDKELSSDAGGSSGGVVTNVYKVFKLSVATIPGTLQEVLKEWTKNHETFFEDQPQNVPKASGWGALFRKIHQCEVNADVLRIRRRFDLFYFFQSIQNCGYHDGNRWVYRARNTLAKKVIKQSPSLQLKVNTIDSQLDLWAELGRGYDEWVKEFEHPGCLLLLPLNVSETEYTERRYRKYKNSAAQHLINIGFQNVMREWNLHALGNSIVQGLKERYQPLVEDAFLTPRTPKRHRESDESSAKRPCPGSRADISEKHQPGTINRCHTSMQLLVAAVSVASTHDSAKQQNIDTLHRPPPPPAADGFASSSIQLLDRTADSRTITGALSIPAENPQKDSNTVVDGHQYIARNRADSDPPPFNVEEITRQDMNGTDIFQPDGVDQCFPQIEAHSAADVDDRCLLPSLNVDNADSPPPYYDVDSDEWVLPFDVDSDVWVQVAFDVDSDEFVQPRLDGDGQNLPEYSQT
ncbi:hypothetical protein I7I51_09017 [Histoplasma capsulatum]|uniref:Uncharacterized protein n=1 Tax=Ajellomyces capsulatus TaxID=5037 RepID=A0A8A1M0S5_AJECA|nr:predicted protein [Histoplasma mississippiense (nom. inval.)]EDN05430.1 predicted protein [Histoplasma mississippiense (nom. inval.)]QSS59581.1 hypothetical protein I7I51_09017 [Histoplasma capsulatum]